MVGEKMNKRKLQIIVCFIILITLIPFSLSQITKAKQVQYGDLPIIIIDAGHGEFDGGAVANDSTLEKDINLAISLKLQKIMVMNGYKVIMTRTTDKATDYSEATDIKSRKVKDMKNRLKLMNETENAIFISIHLNKFSASSAKGAQVFYAPNSVGSKELGDSIQKSIIQLLQKDNNRAIKQGNKSTFLLYYAEKPAVIVECGFLSNEEELILLKDEQYQNKMAFSIFCGVLNYLN